VSTTWTLTVPANATPGAAALTAATHYAGSAGKPLGAGAATVQVAYPSLAAAYTTVGITDDADPAPGNLDGAGYSFSAQALASAGVTPGGPIAGLTWPAGPAGKPDTVTTAGQVIAVGGTGSSLSLLATGTNGTRTDPVTVTYADGSTSTATVTIADWYANQAVPGCTLVVTAPYWNRPAGSTYPHDQKVAVYSAAIALTAGKKPVYLTLPHDGDLHVFAESVS
jgi:beta-glucosidase